MKEAVPEKEALSCALVMAIRRNCQQKEGLPLIRTAGRGQQPRCVNGARSNREPTLSGNYAISNVLAPKRNEQDRRNMPARGHNKADRQPQRSQSQRWRLESLLRVLPEIVQFLIS